MMTQEDAKRRKRPAGRPRHPFGDHATSRLLRTMPVFKVVHDIPEHLSQLLERLEETERSSAPKLGAGAK